MGKRGECSYNPQLGYLKTIFAPEYDFITQVLSYEFRDSRLWLHTATHGGRTARVCLSFVSETAWRVQMWPLEAAETVSSRVLEQLPCAAAQFAEEADTLTLRAGELCLCVQKQPWKLTVRCGGRVLAEQQISDTNVDNMAKYPPFGFRCDAAGHVLSVQETMVLRSDEHFYGFGEKFTDFDKRGQRIECWQSDALCTNSERSYKHHPFFQSSRGFALFVNSFTRTAFDMGRTSGVSWQLEAEDTYLDYVGFAGGDYKARLREYMGLFGPVAPLPRWAFGLWMSRCSYQSRAEIEQVLDEAERRGVQIDVIHIDNWQRPDCSGAWVWDEERFPHPQEMIAALHRRGVHLSLWIYPYLSERSPLFAEMAQKGYLVRTESGEPVRFSPMATVDYLVGCFDFSNPEFRAWYAQRVRAVLSMGVDVVKTDFSEAVPETAVYADGMRGVQGHNRLPWLYAKTIYDIFAGVRRGSGEPPMLWCRSGYAGAHTIPAVWAGDSSSARNNHACLLRGALSAAMSGIPFWGFDLGGFYNTDSEGYECLPDEEDYVRSVEFGMLAPLARCHGKTPREPWHYSARVQAIFDRYNRLRHRLQPYLYAQSRECVRTWQPMMRPLAMEFPQDPSAAAADLEYLLGSSLLVAPVFDQDPLRLYLPQGLWAEPETGALHAGGRWETAAPSLEQIPVFVRENSALPLYGADGGLEMFAFVTQRAEAPLYEGDAPASFAARLENGCLRMECGAALTAVTLLLAQPVDAVWYNGRRLCGALSAGRARLPLA